jgi:hypothetical protein
MPDTQPTPYARIVDMLDQLDRRLKAIDVRLASLEAHANATALAKRAPIVMLPSGELQCMACENVAPADGSPPVTADKA